jgi:serine/threonine protein kinase
MDPTKAHGIIAKISDFGISTILDPDLSHLSNFGEGTPFYTAPEILNSRRATKTSDVSV